MEELQDFQREYCYNFIRAIHQNKQAFKKTKTELRSAAVAHHKRDSETNCRYPYPYIFADFVDFLDAFNAFPQVKKTTFLNLARLDRNKLELSDRKALGTAISDMKRDWKLKYHDPETIPQISATLPDAQMAANLAWMIFYEQDLADDLHDELSKPKYGLDYLPPKPSIAYSIKIGDETPRPDKHSDTATSSTKLEVLATEDYMSELWLPSEDRSLSGTAPKLDYSQCFTRFVGRSSELEHLDAFLETDRENQFVWWQISGASGSGKSRLGLEFIKHAKSKGWRSGFLKPSMPLDDVDFFFSRKDKPLLVVVDNASEQESANSLLDFIFRHSTNQANSSMIRFLLIDRPKFITAASNSKISVKPTSDMALWQHSVLASNRKEQLLGTFFSKESFGLGGVSLESGEEIGKSWANNVYKQDFDDRKFNESFEKWCRYSLGEQSRRIQPLEAILLAEASFSKSPQREGWETNDWFVFLRSYIDKDITRMFRGKDGLIRKGLLQEATNRKQRNLATLVSFSGEIQPLQNQLVRKNKRLFDNKYKVLGQCAKILGNPVEFDVDGTNHTLRRRTPTILSDFQVLMHLYRYVMPYGIDSKVAKDTKKVIGLAWKLSPQNAYSTFLRIIQFGDTENAVFLLLCFISNQHPQHVFMDIAKAAFEYAMFETWSSLHTFVSPDSSFQSDIDIFQVRREEFKAIADSFEIDRSQTEFSSPATVSLIKAYARQLVENTIRSLLEEFIEVKSKHGDKVVGLGFLQIRNHIERDVFLQIQRLWRTSILPLNLGDKSFELGFSIDDLNAYAPTISAAYFFETQGVKGSVFTWIRRSLHSLDCADHEQQEEIFDTLHVSMILVTAPVDILDFYEILEILVSSIPTNELSQTSRKKALEIGLDFEKLHQKVPNVLHKQGLERLLRQMNLSFGANE